MKIDKDVPDGTVLMLGISYPPGGRAELIAGSTDFDHGATPPKVFTYAALKMGGLWYFTGAGRAPTAAGWGAVERWLGRDNRQLEWVRQASRWDHLWPVGEAIEAAQREDADFAARVSTCRACPSGCPSCTKDGSDCECYEHQNDHPDANVEAETWRLP